MNILPGLALMLLLCSCQAQQQKTIASVRDTTITTATSFSTLFLDSVILDSFVKEHSVSDSAALNLRIFYSSRNYQFAWFTEDGIAEHTLSFWNLHNNYIKTFADTALKYKLLHQHIYKLLNEDTTIAVSSKEVLQTELQLTKHFFEYSGNAYLGKVDPDKLQWHIPRKKINALRLLDSLIAGNGKNIEGWEPVNKYYQRLKKELVHFYEIEKRGGWNKMVLGNKKHYRVGDSSLLVRQLKQRFLFSGDHTNSDSNGYYTTALIPIIKSAQKSFGIKQDGIISTELINQLNVPVQSRIKQLLINLERMRWVPEQPAEEYIIVNIPEFRLHVFEGEKKMFSTNIVVGKEAHKTVIFTGNLKHVVFSPYWNVPRSIVRNEILPAIRRNRNYLAKMNMEQTGYSEGLPVIRQKPGGANALGKVKFIFPNSYNIYFHDTPAKSLFNEENRAFSHGCIRLAEPEKLAAYLLHNQPEWTAQKMKVAMSASIEKWVLLKKSVPVFITYFTAWVDSEGLLNFRDDIYGHDKKLATHLLEE